MAEAPHTQAAAPGRTAHGETNPGDAAGWEAEHWAQLQTLFHLAADAEPGERTRILREATADEVLLQQVLSLLEEDEPAGDQGPSEVSGAVGPYRVLRLVGTGGLGAVYLAERMRGGAVKQYALKVLSLHAAGSGMRARFLREQQMLSSLDHPHIVRLLDAGFTENDKPYLAMDYVDGTSITAYCDGLRMTPAERVRLFLDVCDAVAYAHRTLIVHLDLKPGNIFVSGEGSVKLLDFGTAKLVARDDAMTTTILATPAYASPEQLCGRPVTTACDVYGLGAVLYELLSGRRPWDDSSPAAVMEHALREDEPPALAQAASDEAAGARGATSAEELRRGLRGDLASIVARCLRSRPDDRYATVNALREDLLRFLEGRPVLARPQTLRYRVLKFVRRKRAPLTTAAAALLLILGSVIYAAVRQHEALVAADRAVRMQNFLYSVLRLANTNYSGHPATTINEFLQFGVHALPEYIQDPADQRFARLSLAESMFDNSDYDHALPVLLSVRESARRAGDVPTEAEATAFAGMTKSEAGQYDDADRLLQGAMALRDHAGVSAAQRLWIVSFYVSNRYNVGVRQLADATLLQGTIAETRRSAIPNRELAWALGNLATLYSRVDHMDDARREAMDSLEVARREPYTACDRSFTESLLGDVEVARGDDAAALANYEQGYRDVVACKGTEDLGSLELQMPLARLLVKDGRSDDAARLLEPAIPVWRRLLPGNPEIGYALTTLAQARVAQGRAREATALAQQALAAETGKFKSSSTAMGLTDAVLAQGLEAQGDTRAARDAAFQAERIFAALPTRSRITEGIALQNRLLLARLKERAP